MTRAVSDSAGRSRRTVGEPGRRRDAVDAMPDAHEVVARRRRSASRPGRVRGVHERAAGGRAASSSASTASNARELLAGVRVVGLVGDREVRADAVERELACAAIRSRERDRVVGRAPDAVHAGVDLEVHGERRRARPRVGDRLGQRVDPRLV